ncbi:MULTISPECIES: hypothetical protein [unclassified Pseudomonas]|uniref:hypothetical protein n=1 Tax=unclassified Pseudomonas TaxID=196821 RepID=UPI001F5877D6|nr:MULTISPECIES: hypothetical protein [unclassified Pseudomonas]
MSIDIKSESSAVGEAKVEIEGQGPYEVDRSFLAFSHEAVEVVVVLKTLRLISKYFRFKFPLKSSHLEYDKFSAAYFDEDGEFYIYEYKPTSGGIDTFIEKSSNKVSAVFNMNMKLAKEQDGAPHPKITVHGRFDLSAPS